MKHSVPPVLGHSSTQPVWLALPAQFPTTAPSPTWSGGAGSPPVSAGPVLVCTMCGENTPEGQQGKGEQGDPPYRGGRYRYRDPHFTGGVTEALLAPGFTSRPISAQSRCSFSSTRIPLWFCLQMQCGSPWAWRRTHGQKPSWCSAPPGTPSPPHPDSSPAPSTPQL